MSFGAGVIVTFLALAGLLLAFRAAGEQFGLGLPAAVAGRRHGLALLFFILGLNLSGVFEFATLVPSSAAGWTRPQPVRRTRRCPACSRSSSPRRAPRRSWARRSGFALAQPAALTLLVFAALGVGMALPFVLLTWFPGWRKMLPRPGAWMERLKQFLAFPLYATVAWLVWVLGAQVDNDAVVRLLVTLVVVAFALWAWRAYRGGGARGFSVAALSGSSALRRGMAAVRRRRADARRGAPAKRARSGAGEPWQPFTPARVSELAAAAKPVFVDFTAAWCVTCQVNKRLVLNDSEVKKAFADRGVELVRADWTRRDPAITQALAALGRQGVPVYVLYRPGKEPLLLPEVLQRQTVLDALATI